MQQLEQRLPLVLQLDEVEAMIDPLGGATRRGDVDALGIPIKKGDGPRSTKLDILNPRRPLSILALEGDPADIGSNARPAGTLRNASNCRSAASGSDASSSFNCWRTAPASPPGLPDCDFITIFMSLTPSAAACLYGM